MDSELKQYLDEFREQIDGRFQQIDGRFQQVDAQFQQMREENAAAHEETRRVLRGEMTEMRTELRGEISELGTTLRGEMTEKIAEAVSTLRGEMKVEHTETRRQFGAYAERLEHRFDLLAEQVQLVDAKVDREVTDIRQEMKFLRAPRSRGAKR